MDQAARLRALIGKPQSSVERSNDIERPHSATHIIAVTSGKGGVGKTTVAVNLALLLAERGRRTLIVDADLGLANVDVMLGLPPGRHLGQLLLPDGSPTDVAMEGPMGVTVISGGSGLRELAQADSSARRALRQKLLDYYCHFDCVIIDTSPGIGDNVLDFLSDAHDILLVTTPEPTSLRDTYAATKAIARRIPETRTTLVVNMLSSAEVGVEAVTALNAVTTKFLDRGYDMWFEIETDPMICRAVNSRRAAALLYPRSPAIASLRRLAAAVVGSSSSTPTAVVVQGGSGVLATQAT